MSGQQIATTVTAFQSKLGYNGISLTNRDNDLEPEIVAGSTVEISNTIFIFSSAESVTGWSSITTGNTAYIYLTPAGTAGNQTVTAGWSETAPIYVGANGGFYLSAASTVRAVSSAIKHSATEWGHKQKLTGENVTTGGTTVISHSYTGGSDDQSVDFTVFEPGLYYADASGFFSSGAARVYINYKLDGTYIGRTGNTTADVANELANVTSSAINQQRGVVLMPGVYRLYITAISAVGTITIYLYRAGRQADVTQ